MVDDSTLEKPVDKLNAFTLCGSIFVVGFDDSGVDLGCVLVKQFVSEPFDKLLNVRGVFQPSLEFTEDRSGLDDRSGLLGQGYGMRLIVVREDEV